MAATNVTTGPQGLTFTDISPNPGGLNLTALNLTYTLDALSVFNVTDDASYSNVSLHGNTTAGYQRDSGVVNSFFYIVAVLLFYSLSIIMLMIKYIKREELECELDFYYLEFVKREHISSYAVDPRTSHVTMTLEMFNEKEKEATAGVAKCNLGAKCQHGAKCNHGAKSGSKRGAKFGRNHSVKLGGKPSAESGRNHGATSEGSHGKVLLFTAFESSV